MPVPNLLALTSIADNSSQQAAPLRNNYSAIQSAVNSIIGFLTGGSVGSTLRFDGTNWAPTTNIIFDNTNSSITFGGDITLSRQAAGVAKFVASSGSTFLDLRTDVSWLRFGAAADCSISRSSAGFLGTSDSNFSARFALYAQYGTGTQLAIGNAGPASQCGISFQNGEFAMYRTAASTLRLDAALQATAFVQLSSGPVIQGSNAGNFQTTVGAAGGASGLPATPTKYMKVMDNAGTTYVVPCYAAV